MKAIRISWFFGLFCLFALPLHSQLRIEGQVVDRETGEPLSHASVRVQGELIGALTDQDGKFEMQLLSLPTTLQVSYLGYESQFVTLKKLDGKPVNIRMQAKEIRVDDVVISDGLQRVLKDEKLYLFDFEFGNEDLYILLYDKKRKQPILALIDENDSIIATDPGPERPTDLVKDCLGNVHMLTKNFACQVFSIDGEIGMYIDSLKAFKKYVEPCIGQIDEYYFYEYYRFNNQMLDYYSYNGETKDGDFFCHIRDARRMHQLLDPHPANIYNTIARTEAEFMAIPTSVWEKVGKLNKDFQFQQMAFFHPVQSTLRTINDSVYVFDHLNGELMSYSRAGKPGEKIPIDYHERPKWDFFITVDEVRGEAYTSYTRGGHTTLVEIDLSTGQTLKEHRLPRQFPHNVMVRDGVVYFLYQERNYDDVNRLYRLRIKS